MSPPIGQGAVRRPPRGAQHVAGHDGRLAGIVGDERRLGRALVTRADRLVDVGMVRDGAAELRVGAKPRFAHHPRDERRRPGGVPARGDAVLAVPAFVLPRDDPGALRRHRPIPANRRGHARGFIRRQPRAAAAPLLRRVVLVPTLARFRDSGAEERPFLRGEGDDAAARLAGGGDRAGPRLHDHRAWPAANVRGRLLRGHGRSRHGQAGGQEEEDGTPRHRA
jgi:hypothetical protein